MEGGHGTISGQKINNWLMSEGYLTVAEENGRSFKIPADTGAGLGIISEEHIMLGKNIKVNLFNKKAQIYIVMNILKVLEF